MFFFDFTEAKKISVSLIFHYFYVEDWHPSFVNVCLGGRLLTVFTRNLFLEFKKWSAWPHRMNSMSGTDCALTLVRATVRSIGALLVWVEYFDE